ncbi:MAG: hypothetical protein K5888_06030 [Lachnospiraceae bacterium]|nr:hypothetical protein [Lachnospiraceae bacterium]
MKITKRLTAVAALILVMALPVTAFAADFDPAYYAATYPDVTAVLGTDANALYTHYVTFGMKEGRYPYKGAKPGEAVDGIANTKAVKNTAANNAVTAAPADTTTTSGLTALKDLANYKSLKKKMSNNEFLAAYNVALGIVTPLKDKSRAEQLEGVKNAIRSRVDSGQVVYTTSVPHYNDPYGYFVVGVGSCAGCARATGLCLNILGIPYEHVNENQWSHQWCRVPMGDGSYWICDAYGLYCGPEPAPYRHPYVQ